MECAGIQDKVTQGDVLELDLPRRSQEYYNRRNDQRRDSPDFLLEIIEDSGLIPHLERQQEPV
jgi:hypothetical protein